MAELIARPVQLADRTDGDHIRLVDGNLLFLRLGGLELLLNKGLKVVQQFIRVLITRVHVGAHGLERNALQLGRNVLNQLMGRLGIGVDVLDGDLPEGLPLIGFLPGEHLIHHHAQGIQVAAGVRQLTLGLLRRDIVDGADGLAVVFVGLVLQRRDAEVLHLHGAVPQHQDILGLDIPVDDAALMRMRQRPRDLAGKVQHLAPLKRAAPVHILPQGDTVHKLHDYVFDIIVVADVIDADDIGVREHGDRVGLGAEGAAKLLVGGHLVAHDLDGHLAVEPPVGRLIDHGHTALADQLKNLIAIVQDLPNVLVVLIHSLLRLRGISASAPQPSHCHWRRG